MGTKTETIRIYQFSKTYKQASEWEHPKMATIEEVPGIKVIIKPTDKECRDVFEVPWHMLTGVVVRTLTIDIPDAVRTPEAPTPEEPAPPSRGRTPKAAMAIGK